MVKKKQLTYAKAKNKAWDAFSLYIRTRDCVETTGTTTQGKCFTCGNVFPLKKLQAGHLIAGRHNSVLFDERGCHAQCQMCNVWLSGNTMKYYRHMVEKYGDEVVKVLEGLDANVTRQYKVYELVELAEMFKAKTAALQFAGK